MKKHLALVVLALTGAATLAYGQGNPLAGLRDAAKNAEKNREEKKSQPAKQGQAAAEEVLKNYYGATAQVKITGEHEINGVKVYTADVTNPTGQSTATATEFGDVIEAGRPAANNTLPQAVREVTQDLFKAPPADVDFVDRHCFYVTIASGGHNSRLAIDAAGRIIGLKSPNQLHEDAPGNEQSASGQQRQQIEKLVHDRLPEAKVTDIKPALHDPGYYEAFYTSRDGRGYIIINPSNDVAMYYLPLARTELPKAVQRTIDTVLKGEQIKTTGAAHERIYRVTENVGADQITFRVHSNGDVEDISEKAERAITAGHRTGK
jgi:hypothetical protein